MVAHGALGEGHVAVPKYCFFDFVVPDVVPSGERPYKVQIGSGNLVNFDEEDLGSGPVFTAGR